MILLRKWLRLPWAKKLLIVRTVYLLAGIRIGLSLLPFKQLRQVLQRLALRFQAGRVADPARQSRFIQDTTWAINAVGGRILGDAPCLTQALATQYVLARRGWSSELRIGVAKGAAGELLAHAWVEKDGQILIGGTPESIAEYLPLASLDGVNL